jgi:hypothetical protein
MRILKNASLRPLLVLFVVAPLCAIAYRAAASEDTNPDFLICKWESQSQVAVCHSNAVNCPNGVCQNADECKAAVFTPGCTSYMADLPAEVSGATDRVRSSRCRDFVPNPEQQKCTCTTLVGGCCAGSCTANGAAAGTFYCKGTFNRVVPCGNTPG